MHALNLAEQIRRTRRVYANQQRIIDAQAEYDRAAEPVNRAVIAEQVAFLIEHQIGHLEASWLARTCTFLPLAVLRDERQGWLERSNLAWAEAATAGER